MKSETIDGLWQEGNLPVANGIVFKNDYVLPFSIVGYGPERKISSTLPYTLRDFLRYDDAALSSIDSLGELSLNGKNEVAKAFCGEGSYGGDGFVVVLDGNDRVCWAAVFDCSNPFIRMLQRG